MVPVEELLPLVCTLGFVTLQTVYMHKKLYNTLKVEVHFCGHNTDTDVCVGVSPVYSSLCCCRYRHKLSACAVQPSCTQCMGTTACSVSHMCSEHRHVRTDTQICCSTTTFASSTLNRDLTLTVSAEVYQTGEEMEKWKSIIGPL